MKSKRKPLTAAAIGALLVLAGSTASAQAGGGSTGRKIRSESGKKATKYRRHRRHGHKGGKKGKKSSGGSTTPPPK